jgi:hypothetical protein
MDGWKDEQMHPYELGVMILLVFSSPRPRFRRGLAALRNRHRKYGSIGAEKHVPLARLYCTLHGDLKERLRSLPVAMLPAFP